MSDRYPCFSEDAHLRHARKHLPVAGRCNISCGYCDRRLSCVNESRPGVTAALLAPEEAVELARRAVFRMPRLSVAGIVGPGDPLANPEETFTTFCLLREALPNLLFCLSTNGLALPACLPAIVDAGVDHLSVTLNAVVPAIGASICSWVQGPNGRLTGIEGAWLLLDRQEEGIRKAAARGILVKINCVVVPGVNDHHVADIARAAARRGARLMNCIALVPVPNTPPGNRPKPDCRLLARVRDEASPMLPQMRHCARCRADDLGMPGESGVLVDMRTKGMPNKEVPMDLSQTLAREARSRSA